jgi:hypothetical protein
MKHHESCTKLWTFTEPPQYVGCFKFTHPTGRALEKANQQAKEFNQGVLAGHNRTLTITSTSNINQLNCPSNHSKTSQFCNGWDFSVHFARNQLLTRHPIATGHSNTTSNWINEFNRNITASCPPEELVACPTINPNPGKTQIWPGSMVESSPALRAAAASDIKQISIACFPTESPTQMFWWNWCIW